jgi:hypothetical protein
VNRKTGIVLLAALTYSMLAGCAGGGVGGVVATLNPFAGNYTGTQTYTTGSVVEPLSLHVNGTGHVTGSFIDPTLGNGTLAGNVAIDGSVSGTTLNGANLGSFTMNLVLDTGKHFTGTGTFTVNSTDKAVTIDITKQ